MILVMVGAINVMLWTMQQQNRVTETIIEKTNSNLNKLNEDIEISNVRVDGGKLNMTVTNIGGAAATLKTIYIVNETAKEQYRYDLDLVVDGRQSKKDIGQVLPLTVKDNTRYSVRLITESGNIATTSLTPLSSVALPMQLYLIPPTVTPGENVTVLFAVTNNLTDSSLGKNVTPTLSYTSSCAPGPSCQLTQYVTPSPSSAFLTLGNTVLFKWVYKVTAPDAAYFTFTASLVGAKPGNQVTERVYAKLITESQVSSSTETIIFSSLVQRPEIFLITPGPFGDAPDTELGVWGIVVVNPTEVDMEVNRIVLTMFTVAGSSQSIVDKNCHTGDNPIWPNVESEWSCPADNKIQWKRSSGEVIEPYGVRSFMTKIYSKGLTIDEQAFMTSTTVFTSMGQFTKTGYATGMKKNPESLVNVYLTTASATEATARDEANIKGNMSNIQSGSQVTLRVAISDFDTDATTMIKDGARLVINIPKGFTVNSVVNHTQFTESIVPYGDGSSQIIAVLNASEDIGDVSGGESKIIQFTVTAPVVTKKKVYIMYTLLDGDTQHSLEPFPISAFAEIALHVRP
jgi:hypothetical protein